MKKFTLIALALGILFTGSVFAGNAYRRTASPKAKITAPMPAIKFVPKSETTIGANPVPLPSNKQLLDDPSICLSRYDLMTNSSDQNRIYLFPDGTMGGTTMMSHLDNFTDRGTGYDYFDGTSWGPLPSTRIESEKTGWPSYCPLGANGEVVVTHTNAAGLMVATRPTKGTGTWTLNILAGPPAAVDISWPRTVTNGPNHTYIHILAVTYVTYGGMTNQILYYRSLDGGATWDKNNFIIPGVDTTACTNFGADIYTWAEPHGDTLAFTVGDSWQDQFIMKSNDNGNTWTKTIVYHSPYNKGGNSPDFFYCPDGTSAIAIDRSGMVHLTFGLQQDSGSPTAGYYRPYTQGLIYWNESMPQLRDDLNPDSLFATGNLVGWVKDTMVFYPPTGVTLSAYYSSLTSNPQLVIDNNDRIFSIWAGATSLVDPNNYNLRHIYGRDGHINPDGTVYWLNDSLVDLTGDWIQYNFAECMYPSASPTSDANVYILFMKDDYGGSYVKGMNISGYAGQTSPSDNNFIVLTWQKPVYPPVGVNNIDPKPAFSVEQNYPNPVQDRTTINVYLQNAGDLSIQVTNTTGQVVMKAQKANAPAGLTQFVVEGNSLAPGVYFYTVKQGTQSITKKMIVQ
ncbi:MAG: T9SS type A sorting domain-containing protein [Bacteroidetes bacterium]|nr:T9SS type A sorting domain-containing protein [Bacteroidota bacterium]